MSNTPSERFLSALYTTTGHKPTQSGTGWSARCPAHDDQRSSLSVGISDDGKLLVYCHADCETADIVAAVGLTMKDLFPAGDGKHKGNSKTGRIVATYDYCDESGKLLFQSVRFEPKGFSQRQPDGKGGWMWSLKGVRRVLYRLPELLAADVGETVYVVEGEKDCNLLAKMGLVATTNPGGAGKWREEYSEMLRDRHVAIIPDNDGPGRKHAQAVARSIHNVAASVKVVELPGLPEKGDVSDWLGTDGKVSDLLAVVEKYSAWKPATVTTAAESKVIDCWPESINEAAYHGLAGDVVRAIEPHSEADPVALLIQFLVSFGSVLNRSPHFTAEADKHFFNLFAVLVGESSKSRKGTSWGHIRNLFHAVDSVWADKRIMGGLSSGEGLIWQVRDPITKREAIRERKRIIGYEDVEVDPGVSDKRLLVFQPEFASVLKVMTRESNTLSAIIRQAWDFGDLRTLTKNSPANATGAHISIVGHITKDELLRHLTETEAGNGFGNRFLWLCVRRSKYLPEGGRISEVDFAPLIHRLSEAVKFARTTGEIHRDDEARGIWAAVYPELSEGKPGLLGAMISRAEAQVMRLASLYALLEHSNVVRAEHLMAALALWQFCEASARFVFGSTLGDPTADEILAALRRSPDGMTRTDINNLFGRHCQSAGIRRALRMLLEKRLARCETEETEGRPAERWFHNTGT